ncbi:2200_t:CDS:2 [Paraglomus brasilianum]|uniref:2200_t:CDS:1 n=1 Tax=Paraglomus brasilianum TaxID=144538 RepID=A0A9N9BJ49_9GLOM|nr:2200_t:CDS:2 [Paraglomus brasilianum]
MAPPHNFPQQPAGSLKNHAEGQKKANSPVKLPAFADLPAVAIVSMAGEKQRILRHVPELLKSGEEQSRRIPEVEEAKASTQDLFDKGREVWHS